MDNKHILDLLYETKGMNGFQMKEWLTKRTRTELDSLDILAGVLGKNIGYEKDRREDLERDE